MLCFDVDGTLLDYGQRMPPVFNAEVIARIPVGTPVGLLTNQSGIARALAGQTRRGSTVPYPTPERFLARLRALLEYLRERRVMVEMVLVATYNPEADPEFCELAASAVRDAGPICLVASANPAWRKPSPRMLQLAGCSEYWGDDDTDAQAAAAAGVPFQRVPRFYKYFYEV